MALSFKDSLKKSTEIESVTNSANTKKITLANDAIVENEVDIADMGIMTLDETNGIAAYAGDDGNWQQHNGYVYYRVFSDNNLSVIDDKKDINLDARQFNITQEENSQYIPFEMSRYYDGYDLVNSTISVHYETSGGVHGASKPVNVTYNNEKIRFAWLVDAGATADVGKLKFEIHAYGTVTGNNGKTLSYVWKSKTNENLNVLQSLCDCEEVINKIDDSWLQELVTDITEKIAQEIAGVEVGAQVAAAEDAAKRAENAAANAKDSVESALTGYATETYVNSKIEEIDVSEQLENYALKTYVDEAIENVDVSEELANYVTISGLDEKGYATETYVGEAIAGADISDKLNDYYKKTETYSSTEIDEKLDNVSVDLTGYATETYVNTKTDALSSSISTNTTGISSLSEVVKDLQETVNSVDTSPRKTYDLIYNNLEDENSGENVLVFYEIENEKTENEVRTVKQKYTITGGSGGTASSNTLYIYYDKDENDNNITQYAFTVENVINKEAIIYYDFSGTDPVGDSVSYANATWQLRRGSSGTWTTIKTETIYPNTDIPFNISEYIPSVGTYSLRLSVSDDTNAYASKTWSIQQIDFKIESTFNDRFTYPIGTVSFDYTPYGAISKDVYFVLDGKEIGKVTTSVSGIQSGYEIPAQSHGAHLLEVYMIAEINGNKIESNHVVKDIIWYDSTSTIPVIGTTYQNFTARQYDATNIEYTVYDPSTETPTVEIAVDGNIVSTPTLETSTNIYTYKTDEVGEHIITITCGDTIKTLTVNITKIDINVAPVTTGLVFDFNPSGRSNNDVDRVWSNGTVSMSVSDDFDWINGGYQYDENGDQYFCIKAGTSAQIDYQLFADDAKKNGKEFKLVFKTTNVAKPDTTFLSCIDNTTDTDHIGVEMNVHEAYIYGQAGKLDLSYSEEDIIEFEFNINKSDTTGGNIPMVMGYEDGVSTRPMVYDESYNFTQNTPKIISLGSPDCDLHIYRFKVYNTSLTDRGILNNFIADARNAEEMISRYERNQIYDENSQLDPDVLAEKCPWLRVYVVSAPYFTNNKSDKVPNTTIRQIYKNGDPVLDNWTCYDCSHSGQGTSSNNYGASGRNLDFIMNKSQIEGVKPYFVLGDGETRTDKITLTRTSVPVAYLNAKVNIASSNNMTNAMLANRYNEFNPYKRPFIRTVNLLDAYSEEEIAAMTEEEKASALAELQAKVNSEISYIKDTMEFHNCVIFIQETDEDVSTHREFADNNVHFYAIGNIGDSKKSDASRLTDIDDKYECCVEIMDVELPLSDFPVNTMYNAMGYKEDETTHEKKYIWAKNENLGILYELIDGEYVLTEDTEVDLTKTYYVDILEHDDFSEDFTYGWRYLYEGDDDEENAEVFDYCKQKWIEFYRFVTTSTDEEFKNGIGNYVALDSILYYYLFTTRYCMVDNRSKNLFFHYGKTNEVDLDGNPIRKWDLNWDYDNDTACGLNNYGKQVYRYGLEDTDVDEKGIEVFRESDSTFFCRIRDLFKDELKAMYNTLESKNAWHAESFINKADEWQSQFPEELWRVDIERKYIRTYNSSFINGKGDAQFLVNMANGKMKYHRRQWERSQEKYMASKYQSSVASSDNSVFRCEVPTGDLVVKPNYKLKLTPYAYMYLNVKYGTQSPIQVKAEPNKVYEIPFEGDKADIVDVYSSSLIQDFGDLSSCYVATADTSKASKVKRLIFGNATEGYDNPNFTTLTTGANYLLEELNIENVSGLTQSLNLTALNNLKELYAHGSNIGGVTFADGGKIEIAELPAINALSMKNLIYLATLDITDFSKLTTLTVENCNTVDLLTILNNATNINRVRIIGVDWSLEDTSLLERLYAMKGIDKDGYNADQSVLAGTVTVPTIGQYELYKYQDAWSDLTINVPEGGVVTQYKVTFINDDDFVNDDGSVGTILDIQYIDRYKDAIDPTNETYENYIGTPIKESTTQYSYEFSGWDRTFTNVQDNIIVTATYIKKIREYIVQYRMGIPSSGAIIKTYENVPYGSNAVYDGEVPKYTLAEPTMYYLFKGWDKSGIADGDFDENGVKVVNAVWDTFTSAKGFNNADGTQKKLEDLSPVEVYALIDLSKRGNINIGSNYGQESENYAGFIVDGDKYSFSLGHDFNYDDVSSVEIIGENSEFGDEYKSTVEFVRNSNGTGTYFDTGIQLFDEDKDFVLAIDYEFTGNTVDSVLAQCCRTRTSGGFKLLYNNGVKLKWTSSTTSSSIAGLNEREMVVIRHKKGDTNLTVYSSNLGELSIWTEKLAGTEFSVTETDTLVFGCEKQSSTVFANYASGKIHWAKLWYKDIGDKACQELVSWTHESVELQTCGFNRYYVANSTNDEISSFSLLATHLLERTARWNPSKSGTTVGTGNIGGWAESELNEYLNQRLYNALPVQIKSLIKEVEIWSSVGSSSTATSSSNCYITVPAVIELAGESNSSNQYNKVPFINEGTNISYIINNSTRQRGFKGESESSYYWTRSPYLYSDSSNTSAGSYVHAISDTGTVTGAGTPGVPSNYYGVLMMISF